MSWKFNPPPGWPPQPEGWQPPPGWQPDPSWPPAPPGWQFWVPADSPSTAPTQQAPGPTHSTSPYQGAAATPQAPESPYAAGTPAAPQAPESPYAGTPAAPQAPTSPYPGAPTAGQSSPYGAGQPPYSPAPGSPAGYPQPGYGGYPQPGFPGAQKPWYQRGWVIALGAGVLVLLVALVGVGTFLILRDDGDNNQQIASPDPSPSVSTDGGDTTDDGGQDDGGNDDGQDDGGDDPGGTGQRYEGQGSELLELELDSGTFYTVTFTHQGDDWFEVYTTNGGEDVSNLAFGWGEHEGTYPMIDIFGDEEVDGLRIDSSGAWTVEVNPLENSPHWPENSEGFGSTVLAVEPGQSQISVRGTHDGEGNFIVWAYVEGTYPSLLFNEIGPYDGLAVLPANTFAVSIFADGNWTLVED